MVKLNVLRRVTIRGKGTKYKGYSKGCGSKVLRIRTVGAGGGVVTLGWKAVVRLGH